MDTLVVTRGNAKVKVGPHGKTSEGVDTPAPYFQFVPWDTDNQDNIWGSLLLNEDVHARLTDGKDVYPQYETLEDTLAYFDEQMEYWFGCPFTGKRFRTLEEYEEHMNELRAQFEDAFG